MPLRDSSSLFRLEFKATSFWYFLSLLKKIKVESIPKSSSTSLLTRAVVVPSFALSFIYLLGNDYNWDVSIIDWFKVVEHAWIYATAAIAIFEVVKNFTNGYSSKKTLKTEGSTLPPVEIEDVATDENTKYNGVVKVTEAPIETSSEVVEVSEADKRKARKEARKAARNASK